MLFEDPSNDLPDGWWQGDIQANGIKLHYFRTGGDKPPLILLHGLSDNGLCWSRVALELESDFDLIMIDARGHGESTKSGIGFSARDHAADIAATIKGLNLQKPAIIGHSMGGVTAALVFANYPELAHGGILEDPAWFDTPKGVWPEESVESIEKTQKDMAELGAREANAIFNIGRERHPTWADIELPAWAWSKKQFDLRALEYRVDNNDDWRDVVKRFQDPVLLITAQANPNIPGSGIVTANVANQAASLNSHLSVIHIPGAGHNIRRDQFDLFMIAVRRFLSINKN